MKSLATLVNNEDKITNQKEYYQYNITELVDDVSQVLQIVLPEIILPRLYYLELTIEIYGFNFTHDNRNKIVY